MKNKNNKTCSNLLKYTLCEKTTTVPVIPANAGGTPWVIHLNKVSIRFRLRKSVLEFQFAKSWDFVKTLLQEDQLAAWMTQRAPPHSQE